MSHRLLYFLLLCQVLTSCTDSGKGNLNKEVFRYNESAGITSLDPAFANNQANIWACNQLFNGLVQLNDQLQPVPCIARRWEVSEDGMKYTFHLQKGVEFHDHPFLGKNRLVKADDFVFSFNRICDEKTASPGSWVFQSVRRNSAKGVDGFVAENDSTFSIYLEKAFPPLLGLLGSAYCSVVPKEVVSKYGKDFRRNPVGTGPFLFHDWVERSALILHRNENYFENDAGGNKLPYLDAVMISFINDKQSAFMEFLKGKLDLISGLDASYKDDLLTNNGTLRPKYQGKFRMETSPYLNTEYLGILMDKELPGMLNNPLNDIRIRKAINYGFDRVKMIRYLRNGMATPGISGIVPLGMPGFEELSKVGYDYQPTKAAALLAEAGFPNGKGLPEITMSTTHAYQDLCEYMQGQLAEIGIKIKLEINQAAQHRQMVSKQQLSFFRGSWIGDYADAENYLSLFRSTNKAPIGPNYTHYSNLNFDSLYNKAMRTPLSEERERTYHQMDSMMMAESPVIILYYDKVLRLTQNNIEGLHMNAMNLITLKSVRKK
ncbi:MAG: ABC transporter substrate-binding protein [Bacteroidetes bacterium]|nr:ABC transporter substrate-binding protein [Bacteroidota bacterium]